MKGENRRSAILKHLCESERPVPAKELSEKFSVSRQIIVKDIAKLRESGEPISALSRGYVLDRKMTPKRVLKAIHSDGEVADELNLIVDLGGVVEDVFVYHKVYNKVRAPMGIRSRYDVEKFIEGITTGKSSLLKNVTAGYHYHTVSAPCEEILDLIEKRMSERGFLAPLQEYEPIELEKKG